MVRSHSSLLDVTVLTDSKSVLRGLGVSPVAGHFWRFVHASE